MPFKYNVKINFRDDIYNITKKFLNEYEIDFRNELSQDVHLCMIQYLNFQQRLISNNKRKVYYSKEFNHNTVHKNAINEIVKRFESGKSLTPFLSKNILDIKYNDDLLNDWGIHHLHLGEERDTKNNRFIGRTRELLFVRVDDNYAYFINIMAHGDWNKIQSLKIIHNNWADSISKFKLNGINSIQPNLDDEGVKALRKSNVNTIIEVEKGVIYAPLGGGITSSGHSINAVDRANKALNFLTQSESDIKRNIVNYSDKIYNLTKLRLYSLEFMLTIGTDGMSYAFEKNSGVSFKLGLI